MDFYQVIILLVAFIFISSYPPFRKWSVHEVNIPRFNKLPMFIESFYLLFVIGVSSAEKRFKTFAEFSWQFPDMVKVWLGPKLFVFVNSPEKIQKVLLSPQCLEKSFLYNVMDRKYGLVSASVKNKWKEHRRFFNFSFSLKILESFLPTFSKYSEIMCVNLKSKVNGDEFDFFELSKRMSFDVMCATTLGTDIQGTMSVYDYEKIFEAFEITEAASNDKMKIPFLYPQTIYKLTKLYRKEQQAKKVLLDFQHSFMEKRKQIVLGSMQNDKISNEDEKIERNILVDHMILNEEKFTPVEFHDHFLTTLAGYETLANALAHSMLLIAMHPEVQQKLYEEIKSTITSKDKLEMPEVVNSMRYLEMVQKEIFRMTPAIPMVVHETLDDFEIEPGLVIPKDTNLFINLYALHRQKHIWGENANKFDPERFSPENSEGRHPFAFLPFSAGIRICIAYKYSMISLKIVMIKLIETFEFRTTMKMEDVRLKSYVSLKLCTGHMLSIHPRKDC